MSAVSSPQPRGGQARGSLSPAPCPKWTHFPDLVPSVTAYGKFDCNCLKFKLHNWSFVFSLPFLSLQFREILFVDETTGQKAFFTYKLGTSLVAAENYQTQLPGLWTGSGVADTNYDYQLVICDASFYSGFFVSGYTAFGITNCSKRCGYWCGDQVSPYFRSAAASYFTGVAFNINGHTPLSTRLISVGLRWRNDAPKLYKCPETELCLFVAVW